MGHESNQHRLKKFLDRGGQSKTFLFCGPKHSGKGTLARAFALAWVGMKHDLDFSDARHMDVLVVSPRVEKKKDVEMIRGIDIDATREAMRHVSLSSVSGRRAVIIDGVETMNDASQNAFLKTLEEPPSGVVIVLVAHTLDTVLPTVISRCERVEFGPVSRKAMTALPGIDDALWELAFGLPGLAVRIAQDTTLRKERETMRQAWKDFSSLGIGNRLRAGEAMSKNGEKAIDALQMGAFLFRERAISGSEDAQTNMRKVEKILECVRLLKTTNANARLIVENTLLSL